MTSSTIVGMSPSPAVQWARMTERISKPDTWARFATAHRLRWHRLVDAEIWHRDTRCDLERALMTDIDLRDIRSLQRTYQEALNNLLEARAAYCESTASARSSASRIS